MRFLLLLFCFVALSTSYQAQSNYFSLTTEKLNLLKTEAVKTTDYAKAADIKKVLDKRQEEDSKIISLKADIDKKVKVEDFQAAGILQEELKKLSENKKRKEELRTEIAKATAEENYSKASSGLNELRILEGLDEPVIANQPEPVKHTPPVVQPNKQNEPIINNYKEPEKTKQGRKHKTLLAYSPGSYAPIGLMVGMISEKGINLIGSIRLSNNQFIYLDPAVIENGAIDETKYSWHYTNYAYYSYASYSLGVAFKVFGDLNGLSGHVLPTIGLARYRYIYEYQKGNSNSTKSNILDKDQSGYNFNFSPSFLLNYKFINVHLGAEIGIPAINQSGFVFGVGFAF